MRKETMEWKSEECKVIYGLKMKEEAPWFFHHSPEIYIHIYSTLCGDEKKFIRKFHLL